MGAEADFHSLDLAKQNELLQMVASLLRPVIGEIGEVLVKEKDVVVNGSTVKKKPGFLQSFTGHVFKSDLCIIKRNYLVR